jgi:hypothetical protein
MSPNTKTDGPAGDFVFGDAIIPSGVPGGQAIRAASIRTLVDYSNIRKYSMGTSYKGYSDEGGDL